MKFNFKHIEQVMSTISYGASKHAGSVEIVQREEDLENGRIMSAMVITYTYEKQPESYERSQGVKKIVTTAEIFAEHEGRNPVITTQESYEIVPKKD